MSRFADVSATRTVPLGPCECPGTPHDEDWATVRTDLSASELRLLLNLDGLSDDEAAEAIAPFVTEWNLLGLDGEDWPPTPEALFALKGETSSVIGNAIAAVVRENLHLPNPSGAPSPASSRGSASRTRKPTRKPGT